MEELESAPVIKSEVLDTVPTLRSEISAPRSRSRSGRGPAVAEDAYNLHPVSVSRGGDLVGGAKDGIKQGGAPEIKDVDTMEMQMNAPDLDTSCGRDLVRGVAGGGGAPNKRRTTSWGTTSFYDNVAAKPSLVSSSTTTTAVGSDWKYASNTSSTSSSYFAPPTSATASSSTIKATPSSTSRTTTRTNRYFYESAGSGFNCSSSTSQQHAGEDGAAGRGAGLDVEGKEVFAGDDRHEQGGDDSTNGVVAEVDDYIKQDDDDDLRDSKWSSSTVAGAGNDYNFAPGWGGSRRGRDVDKAAERERDKKKGYAAAGAGSVLYNKSWAEKETDEYFCSWESGWDYAYGGGPSSWSNAKASDGDETQEESSAKKQYNSTGNSYDKNYAYEGGGSGGSASWYNKNDYDSSSVRGGAGSGGKPSSYYAAGYDSFNAFDHSWGGKTSSHPSSSGDRSNGKQGKTKGSSASATFYSSDHVEVEPSHRYSNYDYGNGAYGKAANLARKGKSKKGAAAGRENSSSYAFYGAGDYIHKGTSLTSSNAGAPSYGHGHASSAAGAANSSGRGYNGHDSSTWGGAGSGGSSHKHGEKSSWNAHGGKDKNGKEQHHSYGKEGCYAKDSHTNYGKDAYPDGKEQQGHNYAGGGKEHSSSKTSGGKHQMSGASYNKGAMSKGAAYYAYASKAGKGGGDRKDFHGENGANDSDGKGERDRDVSNSCGKLFAPRPGKGKVLPPPPPLRSRSRSGAGGRDDDREGRKGGTTPTPKGRRRSSVVSQAPPGLEDVVSGAADPLEDKLLDEEFLSPQDLLVLEDVNTSSQHQHQIKTPALEELGTTGEDPPPPTAAARDKAVAGDHFGREPEEDQAGGGHHEADVVEGPTWSTDGSAVHWSSYYECSNAFQNSEKKDIEGRSGESSDKGVPEKLHEQGDGVADSGSASTGNKGGGRGGAPPGGGGKTKGQFVIKGSSKATYTSAWGTYQASHSQWKGIGKGRAMNKNYNAGKGARSDHGGESYHGASSSGGAGKEHQGTSKGKGKGEQDQQQYSNYTNAYAGLANRHGTASRYGSSQSTYYSSLSEYYGGSGGGGKDKEKDYNGGAGAGHGHGQHGSNSASGVLAGTTSASGQNIDDSDTATASGKMGRGGKGDRLVVHASADADANACQNYSAKQASENYSHSVYNTSSAAASYHQNHAPNHYGQHHGSSYHHDRSSSNYEEGGGAAAQYSNYGGSSRGGGRDEREKFSSCYSTYGGPEGVAASSGADSKTTAGASSNTTSGGGGGGAGGVTMGDVLSSVAPTSIRRGVSAAAPYVNTYNASATQIRTTSTSAASAGNISAGTATRGKSVSPSKKNAQHNLPHPKNVSGYHYNYPEGHLDYVPATFDLDMRPGSQWDREQMRRVPKVSPYKDFDFAILRTCIWRYCGYDVEAMRKKTGNSLRYQNYKADCVAFLRFLLSQEPANCEWKLGYLLAMCLKHDHEMLAIATSSRNIGEKERSADLRAVVDKSGDLDRAIAEAPERNAEHVKDTGSNDLSTLSILAATPAGAAKKKSVGSGGTGDAAKGSLARAEQEAEASSLETGADVDDTPALSSIQGASRIEMNITPAVTKTDSLVVVGDGEVVGTETTRELLANASSPSPQSKLAQNDDYKPPSTSPSIAGAGAGLVLPQTSTSSKMKDDEFLQLDEEPEQVGGPGQLEQTPNTTNTNSKMIKDLASQASVLEGVLDSQMFSLLTQLFIQDSRAHAVHELESIFFQMGSRKKNSHVLAAMIRGYGCKGYWMSSLKLFLHARERTLEQESKDYEYRYLCYQAALDWALHNENSFMTYTVLRFCQIDGVPIRYPGGVLPHHHHQLHPAAAGAGAAGGQQKFYYEQLGGGMKTNTTTSSTSGGAPATGGVDFVRWPVEELRFAFPEELGLGAPKIRYYTSPSVPEARLAGAYKPLPTHQIMENPSLVEKEFEVLYLDAGLALGQRSSGSNAKQRRTAGAAAAAAGAPQQEHQLHDHSQDPKQRGRGGPLEVEGGINGVIGGHADELLEREHEHHHYNTSATYNDQYNHAYEPIYYPIYAGAHHEDYGGHYDYQHHDTGRGEQELPQQHVELGYSLLVHDNGTGVLTSEEHHGSYLHLEPLEHDQHHHHLHATSPPPYGEVDPGQVGDHLHQQHVAAHPFGASDLVSAYLGGSADPHVVDDHHLIYQSAGGGYHVGAAGSLAPAEFELELDPYTDQPSGLELMHELYHYGAAAAASATQEGQEAQGASQQTVAV